jgi:hypothetical protein
MSGDKWNNTMTSVVAIEANQLLAVSLEGTVG